MAERTVIGVGRMQLPVGWTVTQSEYPSQYGSQPYHTVTSSVSRTEDELGLISIDVSPSHPRLWREPLASHARSRIQNLRRVGPASAVEDPVELEYEALQYSANFGTEMSTLFRVFRQKSRVVTVAFTAARGHFDTDRARRIVESVSGSLLLDLPIVTFDTPALHDRIDATVSDVLDTRIPKGWVLRGQRDEATVVPAVTFELVPEHYDRSDDPPTLTLSLVVVTALGDGVQIEGLTTTPDGRELSGSAQATAMEVDDDTLAVMRVARLPGGDVLTATYAAPDYLFELKPALSLLADIAEHSALTPEVRPTE